MRWRLLLEEFGPEIVDIKGPKNVVADALSRLPKQGDIVDDVEAVQAYLSYPIRFVCFHIYSTLRNIYFVIEQENGTKIFSCVFFSVCMVSNEPKNQNGEMNS